MRESGYYDIAINFNGSIFTITRLFVEGKGWRLGEKYKSDEQFFKTDPTFTMGIVCKSWEYCGG